MCVHVFCAERLPNNTLVWADRLSGHICVYADSSLVTVSGKLTRRGVKAINRALAEVAGAPSLESAKPCQQHPL